MDVTESGGGGSAISRLERIRRKLRAASYIKGGQDPDSLYAYYDRNNSAGLDRDEFRCCLRRNEPNPNPKLSP